MAVVNWLRGLSTASKTSIQPTVCRQGCGHYLVHFLKNTTLLEQDS